MTARFDPFRRGGDTAPAIWRYGRDWGDQYASAGRHQIRAMASASDWARSEACLGKCQRAQGLVASPSEVLPGAQARAGPHLGAAGRRRWLAATLEYRPRCSRLERPPLLRDSLPDRMVAAHLLFLRRLPAGPKRQVDPPGALPAPGASLGYVAPRSWQECQSAAGGAGKTQAGVACIFLNSAGTHAVSAFPAHSTGAGHELCLAVLIPALGLFIRQSEPVGRNLTHRN